MEQSSQPASESLISKERIGNGASGQVRNRRNLNFEQYAAEGNHFINEVCHQLQTENRNMAARITRSVLHAVRDRLPVNEAVHFAQQLPMALKGVYYDQYNPSKTPVKAKTVEDFTDLLWEKEPLTADQDFGNREDVEDGVRAVFAALEQYLSQGQLDQVKNMLPQEITRLIDPSFQYMSNQNQQSMDYDAETRARRMYQSMNSPYGQRRSGRYRSDNDEYYDRDRRYRDDDYRYNRYRSERDWRDDDDRRFRRRGDEDEGFFERVGDRIREGWNNLWDRDDDRDRDDHERRARRRYSDWDENRMYHDDRYPYGSEYRAGGSDYGRESRRYRDDWDNGRRSYRRRDYDNW